MFDDETPTPTAEQAAARRQASFSQAEPARAGSAAKRVPIPAPPKPSSTVAPMDTSSVEANGVPALGPGPRRFFIIKSNSAYNIDLSVETGVWATQVGATLHALTLLANRQTCDC